MAISLEEILGEGVSEPVAAHTVWLRGEIDPTLAWPIVRDLPAAYSRRRFAAVQIPLLGVLTTVALAAGDLAGARRLADDALESAPRVLPRPATFAHTADALVVLATDGEAAAATRFASILADVPLAPWPAWGCLGALCAIRVLAPGTEWLDDIDFGHSLRTGLAAAPRRAGPPRRRPCTGTRIALDSIHAPPRPGAAVDAHRTRRRCPRPCAGGRRVPRRHPGTRRAGSTGWWITTTRAHGLRPEPW